MAESLGFEATDIAALRNHLEALKIRAGQRIVVHSSLLAFGKVAGGAKTILRLLLDRIGNRGTIFVPTFTLSLDPSTPFDPRRTPPHAMGALANLIWQLDKVERSHSLLHSYAGLGADSGLVATVHADRSFGEGSFFDLAVKEDFYWVMLGCSIDSGCPLLHHAEADVGVSYRELVILARQLFIEGRTPCKISYRYYGRTSATVANDFEPVRLHMTANGDMVRVPARHGESLAASSRDLMTCAVEMIRRDPHALLKKSTSEAVHV